MNDNKDVVDKDGLQTSLKTPEMRRILTSSFVGSAIEFYDFILYATASSIVFANLFFAGLGPGLSLFASFSTLAAGYLARPLGGVIFGHFGDKVGRKKALIVSMVMMGAVTVIIGLMPPTASIGMIAPASLFTLRIIQGIAVGGEWGGAALMALEHAPKARRGLAAAFANAGGPAGAILATLILSLTATLTGDSFVTWGWRLPFLLSAVLIVVGLVIRLKVSETPAFQQLEEESEERKVPLLTVFKNYKRQVLIALFATMTIYVTQGLTTVWGVSVAVAAGEDKSDVLNWKAVGALTTLIVTFIVARLSDRVGRKRSLIGAHVVAAVLAVPIVLLIVSGELNQYAAAIILGNGIVQGLCYGPIAAYVSELFPPAVRYTGASVGYQLAAALGAGLSPMIASALIMVPGVGAYLIGGVWALFAVVGAIAVMASRPFSESDPKPEAPSVESDTEPLAHADGK
ncbi:Predicted arabinose efflux permease, MFS family [Brevibacterium siliguriense]|uniref:Predicted arabinose efflux permease, MFS family n=1 Tax=Brevibacterium siliguriense TaxID=1136497 RepID=A0A1H1SX00_9MICO|nr:MFS transporter [Brevibacterium siliguriense]SDS52461.1 Predicted arabinose efflux permease, MFS family [Brevibacterium siliguriense]